MIDHQTGEELRTITITVQVSREAFDLIAWYAGKSGLEVEKMLETYLSSTWSEAMGWIQKHWWRLTPPLPLVRGGGKEND